MNFKKVEIGWAEGTAIFPSRIIQWMDHSRYSHVYWKFTLANGMRFIYESHFSGGVQITPYEQLESAQISGKVGEIYEQAVECDVEGLWNECVKYHGAPYDVGQIIRYYIWIKWFNRQKQIWKPFSDGKYTCNELIIITGKAVIDCMKDFDYSNTPESLFRYFTGTSSRLRKRR